MSAAMLPNISKPPGDLLESLLREQQDLTAVQRFSQWHDTATTQPGEPLYRSLIPLALPAVGEQYAFEVDLQTCSGCKACVTACHSLNGLDEHETWRSVGLLQGAQAGLPLLQHVTTACHHCVDPACLAGCPTMAYEKDAITGIVQHLDDQCFGCQYCILMCPYEVPTYSAQRGIVRKCDMCRQRLGNNELPACVQGCPNGAISIRIVSQQALRERAATETFLPTAPNPRLTIPSTTFVHCDPETNVVAGDHEHYHVAHAHWPLVLMLVLTQMSVGILGLAHLLVFWLQWLPQDPARAFLNTLAAAIAAVGVNLALLHLGRPLQAYRAWLGWRTSWLSREVLAFGVYLPMVLAAAGGAWLIPRGLSSNTVAVIELLGTATGLAAVYCSAMIYIATRRGCWNGRRTFTRFALTTILLGNATCAAVGAAWVAQNGGTSFWDYRFPLLAMAIDAGIAAGRWYLSLRHHRQAIVHVDISLRGSASLVAGNLRGLVMWQLAGSIVATLLLPGVMVLLIASRSPGAGIVIAALCVVRLLIALTVEVVERYLFFASSVSPRMPGAIER